MHQHFLQLFLKFEQHPVILLVQNLWKAVGQFCDQILMPLVTDPEIDLFLAPSQSGKVAFSAALFPIATG